MSRVFAPAGTVRRGRPAGNGANDKFSNRAFPPEGCVFFMEFLIVGLLLAVLLLLVFVLLKSSDRKPVDELSRTLREEIAAGRTANRDDSRAFNELTVSALNAATAAQKSQLEIFSRQISELSANEQKYFEGLRESVDAKLSRIQQNNDHHLEEMRKTVDEKLQSTLEKRLTESFKRVSESLDAMHKGLGEMKSLAVGVGDLKRVLTNVKTRGTWGEVQLGSMLEEVLTPSQYRKNVSTKHNRDLVEFAVILPGQRTADGSGKEVLLPIDAKFPMEDYQRLLDADDRNDAEAREAASKALELVLKNCAKDIFEKYVSPPDTTDFAIMFLPTEGLFAEVARRPGLLDQLQRQYRVVTAGPTTLWSILNSLQMGFRTLAIEKRSGEVWKLLEAVKAEWSKYDEVLSNLHRKITQAAGSVEDTQRRVRVIGRKLRDVQQLESSAAGELLELSPENLSGEPLEEEPLP